MMLLLCTVFCSKAATITSTSTGGNWNDGSTWVGGTRPGTSDDVIIASNATVLMDAANITAGILSLTILSNATLQTGPVATNNIRFNIKGNIVNNGTINFWLSGTQGVSLALVGTSSTWSGTGNWNLAQLVIGSSALEFSSDLLLIINRTITVGTGSMNAGNKRSGVTFTLSGTENATIASESSAVFYGNLVADKSNRVITFSQSGTADNYNLINILGDLTVKPTNRLTVGTYNILDIRNNLSGSGRIVGGTSSDVQISGNGASVLFNSGGSGFRNFTVSRPNGATIDSTITVNQTLSLQNQCKLYLPAGKSANGNQTFSVGQSTSAGTITGDGFLAQQPAPNAYQLTDLTLNGTAASVNLRFSQVSGENIIHNLTINKTAGSVNLMDGGTFQVKNTCTFTNGTFNIGSGTLRLTGSISMNANGNITGSAASNLFIGNDISSSNSTLYFNQTNAQSRSLLSYTQSRNGTITLGNPLEIYNLVDLNSTSTANILNSAGNLTLISNEAGTARLNNLGSASIADSVIVQRFIKGGDISRRGYRLLASPVYHMDAANKSLRRFYFSRIQDQILITGAGGSANGFDASPANGPTIWKYNEPAITSSGQDFTPLSRINKLHSNAAQDFLTAGNGLLIYFRGDRTSNLINKTTAPFAVPEDVVISYKGLLNQGNIIVSAPFAATAFLSYTNQAEINDGFNLVGNPYPSAIDWELSGGTGSAIALVNVNPTVYILDPVTKNYGTYTKGGMYTGSANRNIASGQGFFVKANAVNPSITFTENSKATDNSNPVVLGVNSALTIDFLRLKLQKDSLNHDDILLTFKDGQSEDFRLEEDVADLSGMSAAVSLSALSKTEKKQLAVNALPLAKNIKYTEIFADASANGSYKLMLTDFSESFKNSAIYLKDNFTKDSVDLRKHAEYAFFIDKKDANTFGGNRFIIYFKQDSIIIPVLPIVTIPVVLPILPEPASILLFPNPASTEIHFLSGKRSTGQIRLNIYNNSGVKVQSALHQNLTVLKQNIAKLLPGIYVAELLDTTTGKLLQTSKFIKN